MDNSKKRKTSEVLQNFYQEPRDDSNNKKMRCWGFWLIYPDSKFKITWDLIVILLSVYNSVLIPYEFAYSLDYNILIDLIERGVDLAFMFDIIINFRTAYIDSKTGEMVTKWRKITINYVLYGRFWIDVIASLPLEITSLLVNTSERNLRFFQMLKMVRLLRLGRMITFLKTKQTFIVSLKIVQLLIFLVLAFHWTNWIWYLTVQDDENWFPPSDLDFKETKAYSGDRLTVYIIFYYYAVLILTGEELLPTDESELYVATFLAFVGTIMIGLLIGEFSSLLSAITKNERENQEQEDMVITVMQNLKIPDQIQNRVTSFQEFRVNSKYIDSKDFYDTLPTDMLCSIKSYQIRPTFISKSDVKQIHKFVEHMEIEFYLADDIILKEGCK